MAWCMADTFASYESKRPGGHIYMGGYVIHIARRLGFFGADVKASMTAHYRPESIGRATLSAMRIPTDIRGVEFRICLQRGVLWVLQQLPQPGPQLHDQGEVHAAPVGVLLQPPPRGRRLVFRDPGLRDQSQRLDRLEDLVAWKSAVLVAVAMHLGVSIPPLPQPRHYLSFMWF
ncbi:hypothetical protein E3N88_16317 [Mikania micrantha]|uniref:Uncharacterized protein n=1 Tax=Mikania micrantha TaxID=192012 RepID=A0A5N6NZB6_9ASTR|nr:hypothetical protein E3N88_16317 [Mikania micrantha]